MMKIEPVHIDIFYETISHG